MLWTSLYLRANELPALLRKHLHPGTNGAFRVLLFAPVLVHLVLAAAEPCFAWLHLVDSRADRHLVDSLRQRARKRSPQWLWS